MCTRTPQEYPYENAYYLSVPHTPFFTGAVWSRVAHSEKTKKNRLSHEHSKYEKDSFSVIKLFDQKTVQRILFDSPSLLYHTFRQLSMGFEKLGGVEFFAIERVTGLPRQFESFFLYIIYRNEISVRIDTERWVGFRREGTKKLWECGGMTKGARALALFSACKYTPQSRMLSTPKR